ncbi:MAG: hypothetical protein JWP89_3647 [Schlesneria sp.]|nr:hypothetical protein [Schlesneria sp.]
MQSQLATIQMRVFSAVIASMLMLPGWCQAAEWYCDPVNGTKSGDGTKAHPWGAFGEVVAAHTVGPTIKSGDTVFLLDGQHGNVTLYPKFGNVKNTSHITVQAMPGHKPLVSQLAVRGAAFWTFREITFAFDQPLPRYAPLVKIEADDIVFERNTIYTVEDASKWSPEDWAAKSITAMSYDGSRCVIRDNTIKNVRHGLYVGGDTIEVTGNTLEQFADDGLRFSGSNITIKNNSITDNYCLLDDKNHNDGIQGWNLTKSDMENVVIDSNTIIASTGKYPNLPLIRSGVDSQVLQGIVVFDGGWKNITVTNNIVITAAYHGISFYGVDGLKISNNTVITSCSTPKIQAWIGVFNRKNGNPSKSVVVRDNIAARFSLAGDVKATHNLSLIPSKGQAPVDPSKIFKVWKPAENVFDLTVIGGSSHGEIGAKR